MPGLRIRTRHICQRCHKRPAIYSVSHNGVRKFRAAADHDLCRQCWSSEMDSLRAKRVAERASADAALALHRKLAKRNQSERTLTGAQDPLMSALHQALFFTGA